jgi:hypothetical protein
MDTKSPTAKAPHNAPRDLQARLYREIGISAVAAALEVSAFHVEQAIRPRRDHRLSSKAA